MNTMHQKLPTRKFTRRSSTNVVLAISTLSVYLFSRPVVALLALLNRRLELPTYPLAKLLAFKKTEYPVSPRPTLIHGARTPLACSPTLYYPLRILLH